MHNVLCNFDRKVADVKQSADPAWHSHRLRVQYTFSLHIGLPDAEDQHFYNVACKALVLTAELRTLVHSSSDVLRNYDAILTSSALV